MRYYLSTPYTLEFFHVASEADLIEAAQEFGLGVTKDIIANVYFLTAESANTMLQAISALDLSGTIIEQMPIVNLGFGVIDQ